MKVPRDRKVTEEGKRYLGEVYLKAETANRKKRGIYLGEGWAEEKKKKVRQSDIYACLPCPQKSHT